jgi:hypothetical protein
VREFLAQNTSHLTGIGTGEIIHAGTSPDEPRSQVDVIIHNNRYPKISMATGIDLFFVETVSSFIEIKSSLKKEHLKAVARTTKAIKSHVDIPPQRFNPMGLVKTPRPYSFVFSYDGPSKIQTVVQWMKDLSLESDYGIDRLRETAAEDRSFFSHLFIDGVFILGKGYAYVDALPWQSRLVGAIHEGQQVPDGTIWGYSKNNELPVLWVLINILSESYLWNNFNMSDYLGAIGDFMTD